MKQVLAALAIARQHIKANPIKKDGRNTFSKYDYFTPELVNKLVTDACNEANLIAVFNLKNDELGFYGECIITELESGESLTTIMRTAKPNITATNETQQMGGMNTYAKRYTLMSLFDIEDNSIDFDAQDNAKDRSKEPGTQTPLQTNEPDLPWLNKTTKDGVITEQWKAVYAAVSTGKANIKQVRTKYKVGKELAAELQQAIDGLQPA